MSQSNPDYPPSSAPTETVLQTENLTRRFGTFTAVDDVSLEIERGELHSIIGPNGAGKTTFFGLVTGALSATEGQIWFNDEEITEVSEDARSRAGIVRAFQITQLFPDLSVQENLRLAAQSRKQSFFPLSERRESHEQQAANLFDRITIDAEPTSKAKFLSHGDKKKLEIAMSAATDPELLLLDEPTSGVSGAESEEIFSFVDELADSTTVLLIEHDVDLVLEISDRITVLHQGAKLAQGRPDEIVDNEDVQRAYLGGY